MNQEDARFRAFWLFFLCLNLLTNIFSIVFLSESLDLVLENSWLKEWVSFFYVLTIFGFTILFYFCAYKKPGTKLLYFVLISSVLGWMNKIKIWTIGNVELLSPSLFLYGEILGLFWFVLCWKMLRINKALKSQAKALKADAPI